MARLHVVILTGRSLFAEGVASRLKQYPQQVELQVLDPSAPSCLEELITWHPTAIILDATDSEVNRLCPLMDLLQAIPRVKVIHLDTQQEEIQIVTSTQQKLAEVRDLISVIQAQ